ncbi:Cytochrome P450 monooxygenase 98 [Psilocybe cubensis]|uniref:Cytochrome P450 monooxygenase 98 n=2 Tax=Psilocybe cubensis TaxID=181762 RepID=A0ACB8GY32_PSICU|nr:Cytochrome P450 monooxygenase 98 [Psilocybe cubensis]KAH9480332.1 Cytochrome P450 monooxygenase 98 [Psilocybe cubensis]
MSISTSVIYVVLAIWAAKKLASLLLFNAKRSPYPPGPKPLPLLGNIFDIPPNKFAQTYADWGKKYDSPILHAEALGNHLLILNKREDAIELLEQRAKIYSDRPQMPIIKLMGWEYNVALLSYGDEWRQHRRICQQNFNPQASLKYESIQMTKTHQFLQALLKTPKDYDAHNNVLSIGLTMAMMYGYDIKSPHDPVIETAEAATILGGRLMAPGGSLINVFPLLRHVPLWFPGAISRNAAEEVKRLTNEVVRIPTEFVKKSLADGTAVSSLVTDFYEKKYAGGGSDEEEFIIKNVAYTVYGGECIIVISRRSKDEHMYPLKAASDTTISASGTFFHQMVLNPEIQKKAQAELDRVLGTKRLPTLADRKSLPYIEAIYREVLRFKPPIPISVPHSVTTDDTFKGYFIPEGTTVFPNIWAMTHDEDVYPEPFAFKPERFFDENGKLNNDDRVLAYGFGRRICVGKAIASSSLWLQIASVLACFTIDKAKDENGNEVEINNDYEESALLVRKCKFDCEFNVRSPDFERLILESS